MKTHLILTLITLIIISYAQDDPCAPIPTCKECVAQKFCGWCSSPILYIDGTRGKKCAYQGIDAKPFVCDGTYQTETCIEEHYTCSNHTYQCTIVQHGSGMDIATCMSSCFPPTYFCDPEKKVCFKVNPGNGTDLDTCNKTCGKPPPKLFTCDPKTLTCQESQNGNSLQICNETCGKSHNITPGVLPGKWRGLQVNIGYKTGEWKMDISNAAEIKITSPDGSVWAEGVLQQMDAELWIVETSGIRRSIFALNQLPTVRVMALGIGTIGLHPPPDFDSAMSSNNPNSVFVFYSCLNADYCQFSYSDALKYIKTKDINDKCSVHPDCETCIGDKTNRCGWCSTNVIYHNGTVPGKQCAGHNGDGSKYPFICNGMYSTETCNFPTVTDSSTGSSSTGSTGTTGTTGSPDNNYECNPVNLTCFKSNGGSFKDIKSCQDQCGEQPYIPPDVLGVWRGLQINKNYIYGEWKAYFTSNNVTVVRPDGEKFVAKVAVIGKYLSVTPITGSMKGKKIITLWQVLYGPATKYLTWAWGVPGGEPPVGFERAMVDPNNSEFAYNACLPGKSTKVCNFDH